ncbi:putative 3-hydroxyisobutyrate dehydrogenase [Colletotrichum gloeosporioides]|uniref:3-hydroxyisobutyrate dehydrogenase n=1 Tax=Colletotrichum gloeosporioides TaxID=474922 RepID=A0A8H4C9U7_COLGL|nr:putative 3-hydroxyisobutyrate dehydrogenase [Colletotrichum gloeosporioides]KAF3800085.1 putative 3-hydroxyisobutyrate dehydrogenase [Colletotrichum gloeosporioides]
MTSTIKSVGYIGLGLAGGPLAQNVAQKGFKTIVRDADKEKQRKFVVENKELPVEEAAAGPDAFKDVDVLITMVPNGHIVRDILLGEQGIAPYMKPGCIIVDTSSSDPFGTQQLGKDLEKYQLRLVDSPVTQVRMHGINDGEATFMIGGAQEDIDFAMPVLKTMSRWRFVMGPLGSGHVMKTFNNYVTAAGIAALNDAFIVGRKMGLDPAQITDVLNVGTGRNYGTAHSIRAEGLTRTYASGYGLALLVKDLGINLELCGKMGIDTQLAKNMHGLFKEALEEPNVERTADYTECLKLWERKAGFELPTAVGLKECDEPRDFETP